MNATKRNDFFFRSAQKIIQTKFVFKKVLSKHQQQHTYVRSSVRKIQ